MRRVLIVWVALSVLILSGCMQARTEKILEDLVSNSNFEYQLGTKVTDEMKSGFAVFEGFGMYILVDSAIDVLEDDINVFMNEHPTTYYEVSGYPDCTDSYVITKIETSDPSIKVYGYSVGDAYDEDDVVSFMKSIGYERSEVIGHAFENGNVRIRLYDGEDDVISRIVVELVSSCSVVF